MSKTMLFKSVDIIVISQHHSRRKYSISFINQHLQMEIDISGQNEEEDMMER